VGSAETSAATTARDRTPNLARIEQQGRAFVDQRPLIALMLALAGGYCLGRVLSRV
jgi:hypothetical protein